MDPGYEPSFNLSEDPFVGINYANDINDAPEHFWTQLVPPASMHPLSDLANGPHPPHFSFDPHHPGSLSFSSAPLLDYTILDTPVDFSLETLPPRPTSSRALARGRIPRPRNAFMLFRSAFHKEKYVAKAVEKDHRHISRIIGLCWAELPETEKDVWRRKAELEKRQHALAYPKYRFKPTPRTKQPVKRNVKRNNPKEIERCRKIARLLQDGKSGEALTHAVKDMEGNEAFKMSPMENTGSIVLQEARSETESNPLALIHPQNTHSNYTLHLNPQIPQKRTYLTSEPSHAPLVQSTDIGDPLEPPHYLYPVQGYVAGDYTQHQIDPTSKNCQGLRTGQQAIFAEDFVATSYGPKQEVLDSPHHYSHFPPFEVRGSLDVPSTSSGQIPPYEINWTTYYRGDEAQSFAGPTMIAYGIYEIWSNCNPDTNASASPVQSNSSIAAS